VRAYGVLARHVALLEVQYPTAEMAALAPLSTGAERD